MTVTSATRTPTNIAMFQFASRFSIPMATVPAAKSSRVPAVANAVDHPETIPGAHGLPGRYHWHASGIEDIEVPLRYVMGFKDLLPDREKEERCSPEDEKGTQDMCRVVRLVAGREGQEGVQERREETDDDTECRSPQHGCLHEEGRVGGLICPGPQEREIPELEERDERPEGGDLQEHPQPYAGVLRSSEDHPLGDKTIEERDTRDREGGNPEGDRGDRHLLLQPADTAEGILAGLPDDDADRHEQEGLVEDMVEEMGHPAVKPELANGIRRTQPAEDPDPGNHVADLRDDMVGEETAHVVLEDGKYHPVDGHDRTHEGNEFRPGLCPREEVDCCLRGIHAQEYAGNKVCPGIRIGKPGVERDERDIHADPKHDQHRSPHLVRCTGDPGQRPDNGRAAAHEEQGNPDSEERPAKAVPEEVTVPCANRLATLLPDQECRGHCHELPEEQERDPVTGKDHAERGAGIEEGIEMEAGSCDRCRIENGKERDEGKNNPGQIREAVNPQEGQGVSHEGQVPLRDNTGSLPGRNIPPGGGAHQAAQCRRG